MCFSFSVLQANQTAAESFSNIRTVVSRGAGVLGDYSSESSIQPDATVLVLLIDSAARPTRVLFAQPSCKALLGLQAACGGERRCLAPCRIHAEGCFANKQIRKSAKAELPLQAAFGMEHQVSELYKRQLARPTAEAQKGASSSGKTGGRRWGGGWGLGWGGLMAGGRLLGWASLPALAQVGNGCAGSLLLHAPSPIRASPSLCAAAASGHSQFNAQQQPAAAPIHCLQAWALASPSLRCSASLLWHSGLGGSRSRAARPRLRRC